MKILVICQYYYPEPFRISDICEELVRRGNNVTVVTGTPNYPMGKIYPGYEGETHTDEIINGVTVHRCKIHPRKTGSIHRLWNYYSYARCASKYIQTLDGSFDVVFINQLSPVMMANAGIKYAKKHGKKVVLYCLDLWPASLAAGGITGGFAYKWFLRESKKVYNQVDQILITSKSFSSYFNQTFGITNTTYLPQYAEEAFSAATCRKEPDDFIDLMFAGNIGTAQSVKTIIQVAARCKDIPNLRWHIVGDGKELSDCKKTAERLSAPITFHGRKPIEEMPFYYAMADAMLITMQKDPILSYTLPGKVQSYMAAGKPIIAAIDGETQRIINEANCGFCCDAEDVVGLEKCVRKYVHTVSNDFGENARQYYVVNFAKQTFMQRLETILHTATQT